MAQSDNLVIVRGGAQGFEPLKSGIHMTAVGA